MTLGVACGAAKERKRADRMVRTTLSRTRDRTHVDWAIINRGQHAHFWYRKMSAVRILLNLSFRPVVSGPAKTSGTQNLAG